MYEHGLANTIVVLVTAATVAVAVLCHYEGLNWMRLQLPRVHAIRRRKVLLGVYGVVLLHVAEIWLFGFAAWGLLQWPNTGAIIGSDGNSLLDAIYLSAETFSTVGFGDLAPSGPIRFLCGTEALTGFILITWSASFLFLEMQQFWNEKKSG